MSEQASGGLVGDLSVAEGPFGRGCGQPRGHRRVGACSVGTFADEQPLFHTHQDADGFLRWLRRHGAEHNFWLRDGDVSSYLYDKDNDDNGDGGIDSDCVFYHSGHGFTLPDDGVFLASMGRGSAGKPTAGSNDMRIGDGLCRYLFWSTCFSLRVSQGHSPLLSWSRSNQGLRMVFGFDTITLDSPHLGEHFGRQHRCGYSFSLAWLTASWGISDRQTPVAAACGSSMDEAFERMGNERHFRHEPVGGDWWAWCWLGEPIYQRPLDAAPTGQLPVVALASADAESADEIAERFGFCDGAASSGQDATVYTKADRQLVITDDGVVTVHLTRPVWGGAHAPDQDDHGPEGQWVAQAVRPVLSAYGLDLAGSLLLERSVPIMAACAAVADPVGTHREWTDGMLVRYRQMINGVPVLTPGTGYVDLVLDGRGVVTSLTSTIRTSGDQEPVARPERSGSDQPMAAGTVDPHRLLAGPIEERASAITGGTARHGEPRIVPGSTAVGYEIQKNRAVPVAHCLIEVGARHRRRQRHRITAPAGSG